MLNWNAITIEEIKPAVLVKDLLETQRINVDKRARQLFATDADEIARRDRRHYRSFDTMPPGLQQWWRDRAARGY
jgi:hypothetical protein